MLAACNGLGLTAYIRRNKKIEHDSGRNYVKMYTSLRLYYRDKHIYTNLVHIVLSINMQMHLQEMHATDMCNQTHINQYPYPCTESYARVYIHKSTI